MCLLCDSYICTLRTFSQYGLHINVSPGCLTLSFLCFMSVEVSKHSVLGVAAKREQHQHRAARTSSNRSLVCTEDLKMFC
ncbi:hypothetical protein Mapa_005065 [Marchantia paleacea]|nr:hypothetical protein Mapa_005065 [Marchantia paleacea]